MPKISVFTPSHDPRWLDRCYDSLHDQSFRDWEWIVMLNGGAEWESPAILDPRVRVVYASAGLDGKIGALKLEATSRCTGELLVELDHDDELAPPALERLWIEHKEHPDAGLIYSDTAQINEDGTANTDRFRADHGWHYYATFAAGRDLLAARALEPTPHNVSYIWYAPNHVRAFSRAAYDLAGAYDPTLELLDDQDLMSRLYQVGPFIPTHSPLYLQRVHDGNTQTDPDKNARIQVETVGLYDRYIEPNALAWARRLGVVTLDLGGAHNPPAGYLTVDQHGGDYTGDVLDVLGNMADSTVGVIRAVDFLEHVADAVELLNEIHRVLVPDGLLLSCTPSTDGRGAFQDPTHVSFWNENSWWYYTNPELAKYVPAITAQFQTSRLVTFYPSDWHREVNIPYVQANMIALKPGGVRNGGIVGW